MANKKIAIRLGNLLPLIERDATATDTPIAQVVVRIVANHYRQEAPTLGRGFAGMPTAKVRKAQKAAISKRKKNSENNP